MLEPKPARSGAPAPRLSVIAPAHNEEDNVVLLVEQIEAALKPALGEAGFEILIVDDASTDATPGRVMQMQASRPYLRLITLARPKAGGGNGQSAAFKAGFAAARGELVGSLDADLQNDPADFPRLLAEMDRTGADFVQGDRSAARSAGDAWIRQQSSRIGRLFRRLILSDTIRDTGCSLRIMKREIATQLPLEFKGMHRFIPVTARQLGYTVVELPVAHRHRHAGEPKYGMGITKRALPGLVDCFAVRWMRNRRRTHIAVTEQTAAATSSTPVETHT
ncbi:MAG: glycosyltransferase family 2 protein [Phycisphaera sp.]|nr:glycosyltransferase family 2 protein [Phycisphaera sp.]